jgi:hypothetical protein
MLRIGDESTEAKRAGLQAASIIKLEWDFVLSLIC